MIIPTFARRLGYILPYEDHQAYDNPLSNGITGQRLYQLNNRQGKVLPVISGFRTGVAGRNDFIDHYFYEVMSVPAFPSLRDGNAQPGIFSE